MATEARPGREAVFRLLQNVSLFEGLSADELDRLVDMVGARTMAADEAVFEEGEAGDAFYVVFRGAVQISKAARGGGEEKLAIRRGGEGFGEMALLNDAPRSATARALEPSELLVLARSDFHTLMGPETPAFRLLTSLSRALRALDVRFAARERESAGEELKELGGLLLAGMLPVKLPRVEGFAVECSPVGNSAGLEREIWDTFPLADGTRAIAVLSVGEGSAPPSAHFLAVARAALRTAALSLAEPGEILAVANRALAAAALPGLDAPVDVGLIAAGPAGLRWSGAGHPRARKLGPDGPAEELAPHGPPLGMLEGFEYGTLRLAPSPGAGIRIEAGGPGSEEDGRRDGGVRVDLLRT